MNRTNNNAVPRGTPKQPASSYYRQRLANSMGSASRAPAQPARAAIPNDTTTKKRPLENSYQPPPKRASGSSNGLAPKGSKKK